MKIKILNLIVLSLITSMSFGQSTNEQKAEKYISKKGELTFTFKVDNTTDIENITKNLSIVNFDSKTNTIKVWANEKQFRAFKKKGISYKVQKNENEVDPSVIYDITPFINNNKSSQPNCTNPFSPASTYPTYAAYAQQMQDFETNNPTLVQKISISNTTEGDKELLFVKISDNVSINEQEPKLMLTSSMHGDEIAGYPMMLSLIDYILVVYDDPTHVDHARVKNLVENTELWINPSANPDGTYYNSADNTSVTGSRRANANNVDLNRNYPDDVAGAHSDGEEYQIETLAFMCLAEANKFVVSANFHGGTELVNYPFDNRYAAEDTHPDTNWFENVSVEYATHAQTDANSGTDYCGDDYGYKSSYMTDDDDWDANAGNNAWHNNYSQSPGVTHGAEWYRVNGGRQDYMNVFKHCREVTIELSDTKILPESSLVNYWYYNKDALLDYLTQGTYGFRGVVKDNVTGETIEAKISIIGHDNYGSEVYTGINHGDFYRPIEAGTYDLLIESACYQSQTLNSQTITNGQKVILADIMMIPSGSATTPTNLSICNIKSTTAYLAWDTTGNNYDLRYRKSSTTTWTTISDINESAYTLTGLVDNTEYEVEVRARCSSTSPTAYTTTKSFTTKSLYCSSNGNSTDDEYINRVQLEGLDNNNSGAGTTSVGYSNFKGVLTVPNLTVENNYTITITPEWPGNAYDEGYTVWIDYNRDGDFEDASEEVFTKSISDDITVSGTFTIPNGLTAGNTTMRVSMQYNGVPTSCGAFEYGEVEDYLVNIAIGTLHVEEKSIEEVLIYPNPFDNALNLKLPTAFHNIEIQLFDIRGRTVYSEKTSNNNETTLNISNLGNLASGTYLLKLIDLDSNKSIIRKLIK
ncbi:M14 family zinc carboxypeptidase [Lacinutrix algicola]|uniref:M14 family zinc carboxypeptidase n=1 Tax=Lacinutrix algicola TaxID=342954 RepID=UPI001364B2CC|nr:M14 family zinc carboxypeptidase [Lacinutrix algicola]